MNDAHVQFLSSPDWARMLQTELLPWLSDVADLGDDVLEVGPGPGLTTDLLSELAHGITAVELDEQLAQALALRLAGTNVEVLHADTRYAGLAADRFSAATCFSMLHHIPSASAQDEVFAELYRVLQPGGAFVGTDSLDHEWIRDFHVDDVFVPVSPETLPSRLEAAGFADVDIQLTDFELRFVARKRR